MSNRDSLGVGDILPQDVVDIFAQEKHNKRGRKKRSHSLGRALGWLKGKKRKDLDAKGQRLGLGPALDLALDGHPAGPQSGHKGGQKSGRQAHPQGNGHGKSLQRARPPFYSLLCLQISSCFSGQVDCTCNIMTLSLSLRVSMPLIMHNFKPLCDAVISRVLKYLIYWLFFWEGGGYSMTYHEVIYQTKHLNKDLLLIMFYIIVNLCHLVLGCLMKYFSNTLLGLNNELIDQINGIIYKDYKLHT